MQIRILPTAPAAKIMKAHCTLNPVRGGGRGEALVKIWIGMLVSFLGGLKFGHMLLVGLLEIRVTFGGL